MVALKSPHILTDPSDLTTGTMGAAHLENLVGEITPRFSSLSSSASTSPEEQMEQGGLYRTLDRHFPAHANVLVDPSGILALL